MADRVAAVRRMLEAHKQAHVLAFFDELDRSQQEELLDQIEQIDFEALDELIAEYVLREPRVDLPGDLEPAPYYPFDPSDPVRPYDASTFRGKGEELIGGGKVAAFTVAGGQG